MTTEEKFIDLVSRVSKQSFHGALPDRQSETEFVAMLLLMFVPDDAAPQVRQQFAFGCVEAIDCLRRARDSEFQN